MGSISYGTEVCSNCSNQIVACQSTSAEYSNQTVWIAPANNGATSNRRGISAGTAYVACSMIGVNANTFCSGTGGGGQGGLGEGISGGYGSSSNNTMYLFGSINIDYRATSSSSWSAAEDLNGDLCGHMGGLSSISRGTWEHDNNNSDFEYGTLTSNGQPSSYLSGLSGNWLVKMPAQNQNTTTSYTCVASRVFAFDKVGEYRIVTKNLENNNWACNNGICQGTGTTSGNTGFSDRYNLSWGDFYYDFGSQRAFKYLVSVQPGSFGGSTVYAKEPFFRYVTQLYTDTSLTIPYSISSSGTRYLKTVASGGTNFSAAGNYGGAAQLNEWPWEYSNWGGSGNVGAGSNTQNEKRVWDCTISTTGMVSNATPHI